MFNGRVEMVSESVTFGAGFTEFRRQDLTDPNAIGDVGGFATTALGAAPSLLFSARFEAVAPGQALFDLRDAGPNVLHDVVLFNAPFLQLTESQLRYVDGILSIIVASPLTNAANNLDVDGDGSVSPRDALAVVYALNTFGGGPAEQFLAPGGGNLSSGLTSGGSAALTGMPPYGYLDVNGDNFITPRDALMVISYLNSSALGSPLSAPLAAGSPAAGGGLQAASLAGDPVASSFSSLDAGFASIPTGGALASDAGDFLVDEADDIAPEYDLAGSGDDESGVDRLIGEIAEDIAVAWLE
jgi:hypothetical protein